MPFRIVKDENGVWVVGYGTEFPPLSHARAVGQKFDRIDLGQIFAWDGTAWILIAPVAAGGALTVQEADGIPSIVNVDTLIMDQADGFVVTDLGAGDVRVDLAPFTDVSAGGVPASGGGTTNFLRADGTWAAPAAAPSPDQDARIYALLWD